MIQRVAINGFGRIGRNVLRAWFERQDLPQVDIVAINDVADAATLLHLFKYDTTHGRFTGEAKLVHNHDRYLFEISQGQRHLTLEVLQQPSPDQLPWQELHIDAVLECSGRFRSRADATQHLNAGAKRVIISAAPFDSVDAAIVFGVNHQQLPTDARIISSVSCTTQALVPLVKILHDHIGIDSAMMTEIHAVTADQTVLDQAHRDWRRARASGHNIIPTTSSALGALKRVLPEMRDKIEGYSIRVPTINVAAIDLTFVMQRPCHAAMINQLLSTAAIQEYAGIMGYSDEPLVSSDFNHCPYSLVIDGLQTMTVGRQGKVFAWYDNEWGYANRLLDLASLLSQ